MTEVYESPHVEGYFLSSKMHKSVSNMIKIMLFSPSEEMFR